MAKKRFTDNFESLFGDPLEDARPQERDVTSGESVKEANDAAEPDQKKVSGKDFTDSLESFLSDTFEESFERQMAERESSSTGAKKTRRRRSSLDMLIRSTVEPSKIEIDDQPRRRRITLTFEPQKLEKLRQIARVERAMLKDIINDIVGEYIRKYDKGKSDSK